MALTCIATMLIQIPIPLGYAHLGDSVILITAYLFGPVVGALAGGIGSAMADILTGYPVWAVPTLLIKTIMPLIACYIFQNKVSRKPVISVRVLVGAVVTLLWALGLASAPGLLLKSVVNLIVFIVVGTGLSKVVKNR